MAGRRVHFVMSEGLLARVDAALGEGVSRGEFVRRAVERALSDAGGLTSSSRDPSPAPAEQLRVRSSVDARRDVRPIPKRRS